MNAACPACGRPQGDGILCNSCCCVIEYELGDPIQGVAAMVAELETTLARQGRGETTGKGGQAHTRNGFHQNASIAFGALDNTLSTWARDLSGETWEPERPSFTVARYPGSRHHGPFCDACQHPSCRAMRTLIPTHVDPPLTQTAAFLLDSITEIRRHPAAAQLHDEVISGIRQARNTIDRAANRTIIDVGPCPEEDENGTPCPGQVFAFIPTEDDRPSRMECKANPVHKWTSIQWLRTGRRILDVMEKRKREARIQLAVYGEDHVA